MGRSLLNSSCSFSSHSSDDIESDSDNFTNQYTQQLATFDESKFTREDYAPRSTNQINRIFKHWREFCDCVHINPDGSLQDLTIRTTTTFFDWLINPKRRGLRGRKLRGHKYASSLSTHWKTFRLLRKRETGRDIDSEFTRQMTRSLRDLAKKYSLSTSSQEKPMMLIEDLIEVLQTNLTTTEQQYSHGRHRIQLMLWLALGAYTANRPGALLQLLYKHIIVTLLRDPEGGPHQILIEFTFEFTKTWKGPKDANTFPVPEIMFDPSLLCSPHVYLLGLLFADRAFAAPHLTSPEALSKLDIEPDCNELPLPLKPNLAEVPVFRRSVKGPHGSKISADLPLTYNTILPWMKNLGVLAGILQVARPYTLRYAGGKAFDENGNISEPLRNLIMKHADTRTFLKHYLPRTINVDTQAIIRGMDPQEAMMRAACRMIRSINPRRPYRLTQEESQSVNNDPGILTLCRKRDKIKRRLKQRARSNPEYNKTVTAISNERQRLRNNLLKTIRATWDKKNAVEVIERQLAGLGLGESVKDNLETVRHKPPQQLRLMKTILTLPEPTLEREIERRNAAINAVIDYCKFEEGGPWCQREQKNSVKLEPASETHPYVEVLELAKQSIFTEKRPRRCFMCFGNNNLSVGKRVYMFKTPGDLSKHFKRVHLAKLQEYERIECKVCAITLDHKQHLQRHALDVHGTVS